MAKSARKWNKGRWRTEFCWVMRVKLQRGCCKELLESQGASNPKCESVIAAALRCWSWWPWGFGVSVGWGPRCWWHWHLLLSREWDNMGMLSNRAGRDLNKIYIIHFYIWFLLHVSNNMALRKQFGLIRMSGHFCDKDMPSNYPVSGIIYRACEV